MRPLDKFIASKLAPLIAVAETGDDWSEITRLEAEIIADQCPDCGNIPETGACFYCKAD